MAKSKEDRLLGVMIGVVLVVAAGLLAYFVGIPMYERIQKKRRLEQLAVNLKEIGLAMHAYGEAQSIPACLDHHRTDQIALRQVFRLLRLQQVRARCRRVICGHQRPRAVR